MKRLRTDSRFLFGTVKVRIHNARKELMKNWLYTRQNKQFQIEFSRAKSPAFLWIIVGSFGRWRNRVLLKFISLTYEIWRCRFPRFQLWRRYGICTSEHPESWSSKALAQGSWFAKLWLHCFAGRIFIWRLPPVRCNCQVFTNYERSDWVCK